MQLVKLVDKQLTKIQCGLSIMVLTKLVQSTIANIPLDDLTFD